MVKALLIIDVQRGMFEDPNYQPHDGPATVARMRALLDDARARKVPVFFVQHDGGPGDPLAAGSSGFPIVDELAPRPGEPVTVKRESSAFDGTDLEQKLRSAGIDQLVVCGMQSDFCVSAAVYAAAGLGFDVTLVSDAHTTCDNPETSAERTIAERNEALRAVATIVPSSEIAL